MKNALTLDVLMRAFSSPAHLCSYSKGTSCYLALAKHFVTIILKKKTVKQMTRHSQCSSGTGRESKMKLSVLREPFRIQCCSTDKKKVFNYKSYLPLQVVPPKERGKMHRQFKPKQSPLCICFAYLGSDYKTRFLFTLRNGYGDNAGSTPPVTSQQLSRHIETNMSFL